MRPDWQRRGIGRKMAGHVICLCRDQGCYKIALSFNVKREAAHRFYESLGLRLHGYSFRLDLQ